MSIQTPPDFNALRRNLKKNFEGLKGIKVALLADSSVQHLSQAIRGWGYEQQLDVQMYVADIDQIDAEVMGFDTRLYRFDPQFIILFHASRKLHRKFMSSSSDVRAHFAAEYVGHVEQLVNTIADRSSARVICMNQPFVDDSVFGQFANKVEVSWVFQQRKLNTGLMELSVRNKALFIADIDALQSRVGVESVTDPKLYVNADMLFSLDFLPSVAKCVTDILLAVSGIVRKCLILDLDNTLWGGVIGDDGMERIEIGTLGIGKAFTELQLWVRELKERGIILAVCSKNTEEIAKEPFVKHPDMVLHLDDIAVFVANWESKVDNIRYIQSVLNIGFDSMVFLDDNPVERSVVREHIAGITVPELPEDPALYLSYLQSLNLFETASFSSEDSLRTRQYQEEASRVTFQRSFSSEREFLHSLDMVCEVRTIDGFTIPRVAQLTQRSNQFNLRTIRYTESDLLRIAESGRHFTLCFSLKDKFGSYGLISAVILECKGKDLFIDTWIMSCRVLKRGMEDFVMNNIAQIARREGLEYIKGEYLPTPKNSIVADLLSGFGFVKKEQWELQTSRYVDRLTTIVQSE